MKLEGNFSVDAPRADVWDAIRDPALMARCVPGCESAKQISEDRYSAIVGAKVGPVSAKFNMVIDVEEEIAPRLIRSKASGEEGSRASMLTSRNTLVLEEDGPERTAVSWTADVSITGRLGKYGLGLMKKKVKSLSDEFVRAFAKKLESGTASR